MSDSNVPSIPQNPFQGAAQSGAISGIEGMNSAAGQNAAVFNTQNTNATGANGQAAVAGAQTAGAAGVAQGNQNIATSNQFAGIPTQLSPFITSALQQGFDPQGALYAQQHQGNTDATNASLAARGLSSSPWGAGVAATSDQNFNTNWQATQLGRENTAASTASGLIGAGTSAATTGANLGAQGANEIAAGTALPYQTQTGIDNDLASFLPFLTSVQQQQIADYLGFDSNANAQAGNSINAGKAQDSADDALGTGIGGILGKLFSGAGTKAAFG